MRITWFKNKACLCLLLGLLSLCLLLTGCKQEAKAKTNAEILSQLGAEAVDTQALAMIVNEPEAAALEAFKDLSTWQVDTDAQKMLIVPLHEGTTVRLEQIIWSNVKQDFVKGRTIHELNDLGNGKAIYLQAIRPEGMPQLRLVVRCETAEGVQFGSYIISYDGKDGNAKFEPIKASSEAALIWDEVQGALPQDEQPAEETDMGSAQTVLQYEEIAPIFNLTEEQITEKFGPPTERRSEEFFEGTTFPHLYYGETEFALDNEEGGIVYQAIIADDRWPAPRGIKIGDELNTVLAQFPNEGTGEVTQDPYDSSYKEQLLYGTGSYMTSYGKLIFQNDTPTEVVYATEEGVTLRFILDAGKVYRVEYTVPMT